MSGNADVFERDAILYAFREACSSPTAIQTAEWCARYPQFAEDIEDFAAGLQFLNDGTDASSIELSEAELAKEIQSAREKFQAIQYRFSRQPAAEIIRIEATASPRHAWQATFGSRLKAIREANKLSLEAIAEAIGPQNGAPWIRDIEADAILPDIETIRSLARTLSVSAAYLVNADKLRLVDMSPRNAHNLRPDDLRKVEIETIVFAHRYLDLEAKLKEAPSPLSNMSMRTPEEAEQAALEIRSAWRLGSSPIKSITSLLEEKGVKILSLNMGRCDGLTMRIDEDGKSKTQIVVLTEGMLVERRRFTLAHEFAHVLATEVSENEANHFAGAFLLPADALRAEFSAAKAITVEGLIAVKEKYGASLQAIIRRCQIIGLSNDDEARSLNKACDSAGSYKEADLREFSESPKRYDELRERARVCGLA